MKTIGLSATLNAYPGIYLQHIGIFQGKKDTYHNTDDETDPNEGERSLLGDSLEGVEQTSFGTIRLAESLVSRLHELGEAREDQPHEEISPEMHGDYQQQLIHSVMDLDSQVRVGFFILDIEEERERGNEVNDGFESETLVPISGEETVQTGKQTLGLLPTKL